MFHILSWFIVGPRHIVLLFLPLFCSAFASHSPFDLLYNDHKRDARCMGICAFHQLVSYTFHVSRAESGGANPAPGGDDAEHDSHCGPLSHTAQLYRMLYSCASGNRPGMDSGA